MKTKNLLHVERYVEGIIDRKINSTLEYISSLCTIVLKNTRKNNTETVLQRTLKKIIQIVEEPVSCDCLLIKGEGSDIHEVLKTVILKKNKEIEKKNLTIAFESKSYRVPLEFETLYFLFINILDIAITGSAKSKIIEIKSRLSDDFVKVFIKDQGYVSYDEENVERKKPISYLNLETIKNVLYRINGKVEHSFEEYSGNRIEIYLPRKTNFLNKSEAISNVFKII